MTMHKAAYPSDDVDTLHVSRKKEGRGLDRTQDNVGASIKRLEDAEEDWS